MKLLLLAASLWAAGPVPIGDGAQRLVVGALREIQREWDPDACFGGLYVDAHRKVNPIGPKARSGRTTVFVYYFASPNKPGWYSTHWEEVSGGEVPFDPFDPENSRYEKFRDTTPDDRTGGYACITEMTTDSDEALAIAIKAGLSPHEEKGHQLELDYIQPKHPLFAKLKKWKGMTIWRVTDQENVVVLDAATGKVLKLAPKSQIPAPRP